MGKQRRQEKQLGILISEFPKTGDRVRIAIQRGASWIPVCWVRVGHDGSIYFGLLFGQPSAGGSLMKNVDSEEVRIDYDDLEAFEEDTIPSSSRISFKAKSGEVHVGDEKMKGTPIKTLSKRVQLCLFHQVHPDNLPAIEKKSPNDYDVGIVGYEFHDDQPLYGALFASPWEDEKPPSPIQLPSMNQSWTVALRFRELLETPDLLIQVVLGHGPTGPWPKMSGVVVRGSR